MTSPKRVAASQVNGRRSRGPRTNAGKARASRNARRHGLSLFKVNDAGMTKQVKDMVDAICEGDNDPLLREAALIIAENQLWWSCIEAEKVAVIERLRGAKAFSLARDSGKARRARARERIRLFDAAAPQLDAINELVSKTMAAGRDPELEPLPPDLVAAWPPRWAKITPAGAERDEHEAMVEGIGDVARLVRYERRAWSRLRTRRGVSPSVSTRSRVAGTLSRKPSGPASQR